MCERTKKLYLYFLFIMNSKMVELKELQETNSSLKEELKDLRRTHQEEVR